MALIILGVIILVVGLMLSRSSDAFKRFGKPLRLVGILVIIIGILTSSIVQIEAGHVVVKKIIWAGAE